MTRFRSWSLYGKDATRSTQCTGSTRTYLPKMSRMPFWIGLERPQYSHVGHLHITVSSTHSIMHHQCILPYMLPTSFEQDMIALRMHTIVSASCAATDVLLLIEVLYEEFCWLHLRVDITYHTRVSGRACMDALAATSSSGTGIRQADAGCCVSRGQAWHGTNGRELRSYPLSESRRERISKAL